MEASNSNKSVQLADVDDSVPDMSVSNDIVEEVVTTSELNSADARQTTKTILEDVCTDFESMNVISFKSNKIGVIKNIRRNNLSQQSGDGSKNSAPKRDLLPVVAKEEASGKNLSPSKSEGQLNVVIRQPNEANLQSNRIAVVSGIQDLGGTASVASDSAVPTQSQVLPQTPSSVTVLSPNLSADKSIPSLAQLADAEIVQSGDNVSIIVTNTRLIKVLTNADNSIAPVQAATIINPTTSLLEADVGITQQLNIVDSNLLVDNVLQNVEIVADPTVAHETVISERESASLPVISRGKVKPVERGSKRPLRDAYTPSPASKGRRVTAKMKAEWARQLEVNGMLSCQMPGCSQTYVTVANFQTHFKYCTGKKKLQNCLYCNSLIFSTHKAIMHHMEVEHPDKIEEYKATYPAEESDFEKSLTPQLIVSEERDLEKSLTPQLIVSEETDEKSLTPQLIVSEDNVAMHVEEVTQQSPKKKRKISSKENAALPKRAILKHKIQSIQNSMVENAKEFKKCVRFDNIVDKINSIDDPSNFEISPSYNNSKPKEKKKRIFLTESIVAEKKYFEDDEDEDIDSPRDLECSDDSRENVHTKARMMLNKERYKRYKEYLKLTRDWSSDRKTYSRKRDLDSSLDSSFILQLQNESVEDVHQLNDTAESSTISLNTSETEINPLEMPSLETLKVVESEELENALTNSLIASVDKTNDCPPVLSKEPTLEEFATSIERSSALDARARKEKTCYGRASLEAAKAKQPIRYQGIITYGLKVPGEVSKQPVEQPVSFDSLVDSLKPKPVRRNSQVVSEEGMVAKGAEASLKQVKEEEEKSELAVTPKRKRGRPPKPKPDAPPELKEATDQVKNAKKYSAAMLKSIEKNVKNRKIKLFGVKKNSKFKPGSKQYATQLQSKRSRMKTNKMKQAERNMIVKKIINRKSSKIGTPKGKSVDDSAIQCQENIDNHLLLSNESGISHIQCLPADHNYTHPEVVESQLIIDANNVAEEIEVSTLNTENISQSDIVEKHSSAENISQSDIVEKHSSAENNLISNSSTELQKCMPLNTTSMDSEETGNKPVDEASKLEIESKDSAKHDAEISLVREQEAGKVENDVNENKQKNVQKDQESITSEQSSAVISKDIIPEGLANQSIVQSELLDIQVEKNLPESESQAEGTNSNIKLPESNLEENISVIKEHSNLVSVNESALPQVTKGDSTQENSQMETSDAANRDLPEVTPEAPVKRRRGRPKKNAMQNISSLVSPIQNNSRADELEKSTINSFSSSQTNLGSSLTEDSMQTPSLRKSERVKRRRLMNEEMLHSTPKEENIPEVVQKNSQSASKQEITPGTVKKGRGRPRKYPPKDLVADLSEDKVEDSAEKPPDAEPESANESIRKYSRKGRPRKCVRYADLNSGMDSSESLDGLSSGKDKLETAKLRGKNLQKSCEAKDSEEKNETIAESHDSSYDVEGKIILPLKKRKQRQAKKDDSTVENASTNKNNVDSEILLSDEENEQNSENRDDFKNTKNLRNRRGVKRKRRDMDSSDEDWELPNRAKSGNKTSSRATRQKSSNQGILEMDSESDSSSSERDSSVAIKKNSKKLNDTSLIRKFTAKSRTRNLESAVLKYSLDESKTILPDHKPQKCMWKPISDKDYYAALPSMKTSAYFKIEKALDKEENFWNSLSFFDSLPLNKESCHSTFFAGGPVLCSAWCPTPVDNAKVQYVALATSHSLNKLKSYVCTDGERGLLQLWNVGVLNGKTLESKPFMELSISHLYGPITDMVWCPYGCWEDPTVECVDDNLPRLGMLALACADSNVRIFSIPHPQFLPKEGTCFPIYSASPSITLKPLYGGICAVTRKSMCISISWQKSDNCEKLAAGFGNGMICIWRVSTSATILAVKEKNHTVITPYLVFNAHGTPVSSVSFSPLPGARFLVSSSIDKTLKFWDLIDPSLPFFTIKKGSANSADWTRHYCGAFASLDCGLNCFKGPTFFKECGTENFSTRVLSGPCCYVMKSSMSEWLNALAIADMSGAVAVSFIHSVIQEHAKFPQYFQRPVYLSELKLVEGIVEKTAFSSYQESKDCISVIQDMTEITSVLNQLINVCCGEENLTVNSARLEPCEENSERNECGITENIPDKISEITDIIAVVSDMNDVTNTMDHLIQDFQNCSSSQLFNDGNDSLMEIDEYIPVSHGEEQTKIHPSNAKEDLANDDQSPVAEVLHHLINLIVQKKPEGIEEDRSSHEVLLVNTQNLDKDKFGNSACISMVKEMTNIVSLLTDVVGKCDKISLSDVSLSIFKEVEEHALSNANSEYGCELVVPHKNAEETCTTYSETVEYVLQNIKDVICTMLDVTAESSKLRLVDMNLKISGELSTIQELDNLTIFPNEKYCRNKATDVHLVHGSGLPFNLSEVTDIVSAMTDMNDTTAAVIDMQDVVTSVTALKDVVAALTTLKDVISSVVDLKDVTTVMERLRNTCKSQSSLENSLKMLSSLKHGDDENDLKSEVSVIVSNIIQNILKEVEVERAVKDVLCEIVSNVEVMNETEECDNQRPSALLASSDSQNELITAIPSTEVSRKVENALESSSPVPQEIQSSDYELPELQDEIDESMLSESSSSENDMYSDDELEMADSYMFDQDSFSDESVLSECSLDSNISMCSSLGDSDISEASLDSMPGEQEVELPSSNIQKDTCDVRENANPETSCNLLGLISEMPHKLPFTSDECNATSSVENLNGDCTTTLTSPSNGNAQELNKVSDSVESREKIKCPGADSLVPDSQEYAESTSNEPSKTDSANTSEILQSGSSEICTKLNTETETVSSSGISDVVMIESSSEIHSEALVNDSLPPSKLCDNNLDSHGTSDNNTVFHNKACTENINENNADCTDNMNLEKNLHDSNCILPDKSADAISDTPEVVETVVNNQETINDKGSGSLTEPVVNIERNSLLSKSFSSYEDVISQYGIVFKDMNTASFENIEDRSLDPSEMSSLDQYHITSIKTVAWNPNFGSHFWLFSAGQSGIARLSYISDINQANVSKRQDANDA